GPFGGNDLFVETHNAIDFRLSEHARDCPLRSKDVPVRRGTRWKDLKIEWPERAWLLPSLAVRASPPGRGGWSGKSPAGRHGSRKMSVPAASLAAWVSS